MVPHATNGIIAATGGERDFAQGDAAGGGRIEGLVLLHGPARSDEERVDLFACGGFGGHAGRKREGNQRCRVSTTDFLGWPDLT